MVRASVGMSISLTVSLASLLVDLPVCWPIRLVSPLVRLLVSWFIRLLAFVSLFVVRSS